MVETMKNKVSKADNSNMRQWLMLSFSIIFILAGVIVVTKSWSDLGGYFLIIFGCLGCFFSNNEFKKSRKKKSK